MSTPASLADLAALPATAMPEAVAIPPVRRPLHGTVRPPGSKSLTNRALLLAALADGTSILRGALADADDARVMVRALRQLGADIRLRGGVAGDGDSVDAAGNAEITVRGVGGRWRLRPGEIVSLDLHNAGTATRFLAAAALLAPPESGGVRIDGNARMRQRPIGELAEALRAIGAEVQFEAAEGYPPMLVRARTRYAGEVSFGRTSSSQFVSALMLAAPFMPDGLTVRQPGPVTSASYIRMTAGLMAQLGLTATGDAASGMHWDATSMRGFTYNVEADASGASYFLAAGALCGGEVVIRGVPAQGSLQGDTAFAQVIARFGGTVQGDQTHMVVRSDGQLGRGGRPGVDVDMSLIPDTAMTAAALAMFASGPTRLGGLRTLRVKETDRVAALQNELGKLGARTIVQADFGPDGPDESLLILPPPHRWMDGSASTVQLETYDDHRMAMSLALMGLARAGVIIRDPGCVRKTYSTFWRDLAALIETG
ncbi:MAG: 3-phosphoshikimate 1-carboxyvinyltransferase [Planctomycetaceae bacterium]|nr:3-phosphoshikimate 1-carboxyvinyltransferase [Phycisphaerales bacterium]MCE2652576.1 3-phosphoshikimate 1-carboxyvinyltransferase [Planctomycetaceae bacterium]